MKKTLSASFILAITLTLQFFGGESAFAFGTKFACCRSESLSCLGGGGATAWHTMLRDQALTQVDAKLRCGVYRMEWNTHSCPSSTGCPSGPITQPPPPPVQNEVRVRNDRPTTAFVVVKRLNGGNKFTGNAWFEVKAGQSRVFTFSNRACIGFSVNGVDRIRQNRESGSIYTGELSESWVHPSKKTDLVYGKNNNGYYLDISIDGGIQRYQNSGMSLQGVAQAMASQGLVKYQCLMAESGNNLMFID